MRLIRYPPFTASWKMGESWEMYGLTAHSDGKFVRSSVEERHSGGVNRA